MNIKDFRKEFDPVLQSFIESKISDLEKNNAENYTLIALEHLSNAVMNGGKKIRPYVSYLSYKTSLGKKGVKEVSDILIAIEIFHVFCLVHDDVIDKGEIRYGYKTINKLYSEYYEENFEKEISKEELEHISNSQAILIGDILFAWVTELIGKSNLSDKGKDSFYKMVNDVVIGQMIDVDITSKKKVSSETLNKKNHLKTAAYTFINPMQIGYLMSEIENKEIAEWINIFGDCCGNAYQIKDDIADILANRNNNEEFNKTAFLDIKAGEHTFLTQYIFENGKEREIETLEKFFGKDFDEIENELEIKNLFKESNAIEYSQKIIKDKLDKAEEITEKLDIDKDNKEHWMLILDLLKK